MILITVLKQHAFVLWYLRNIFGIRIRHFRQKNLLKANQTKNKQIVSQASHALIGSRNAIKNNIVPEIKNPVKVIDVAEKVNDYSKQQKGKRFKILTTKQILQKLPMALTQVKTSNTFKNVLNEIGQIIYFLCRKNKIFRKLHNNMMDLIQLQYKVDTIFMNS